MPRGEHIRVHVPGLSRERLGVLGIRLFDGVLEIPYAPLRGLHTDTQRGHRRQVRFEFAPRLLPRRACLPLPRVSSLRFAREMRPPHVKRDPLHMLVQQPGRDASRRRTIPRAVVAVADVHDAFLRRPRHDVPATGASRETGQERRLGCLGPRRPRRDRVLGGEELVLGHDRRMRALIDVVADTKLATVHPVSKKHPHPARRHPQLSAEFADARASRPVDERLVDLPSLLVRDESTGLGIPVVPARRLPPLPDTGLGRSTSQFLEPFGVAFAFADVDRRPDPPHHPAVDGAGVDVVQRHKDLAARLLDATPDRLLKLHVPSEAALVGDRDPDVPAGLDTFDGRLERWPFVEREGALDAEFGREHLEPPAGLADRVVHVGDLVAFGPEVLGVLLALAHVADSHDTSPQVTGRAGPARFSHGANHRRYYRPMRTRNASKTRSVKARRVVSIATLTLALPALAAPAQASTPEFGVGDDGAVIADPSRLDRARDQLGARWVRVMVRKGHEAEYEPVIKHADHLGLNVLVNLTGANQGQFPGWARWIAAHWPTVDAWSVGNEPELGQIPPCRYLKLYEDTRREIRRTGTQAPVLFGELSPHAWRWVEMMRVCRRLTSPPDGVAVHPYQGSDPLSTRIGKPWEDRPRAWRDPVTREPMTRKTQWIGIGRLSKFKRVLRRSRLSAPLWLTEFGFLREHVSDDLQAQWWPRALEQARRVGARVVIAHGAWSDGPKRRWNSPLQAQTSDALAARHAATR